MMLWRNKVIFYDGLNDKVITHVYDSIQLTLVNIFKASLEDAVFPEKLTIAKVIPVKKCLWLPTNFYSSNFFHKVLGCIICFSLTNNNLLHENRFVFQIINSTELDIMQFTRDMAKIFDNGRFTFVH